MRCARFCVIMAGLCAMLAGAHDAVAQSAPLEQFEGTLLVAWGDPHPTLGRASDIRYSLALPDGRVLRLQLSDERTVSASDFGKRVSVSGWRVTQPATTLVGSPVQETIAVQTIGRAPGMESELNAESAALGTRRVLYLLLKFADDVAVPHLPSFYIDVNNPLVPPPGSSFPATVNGFFSKASWNQFTWQAAIGGAGGIDAPDGWLSLPLPKSYYAPCTWSASCANTVDLAAHAWALARAEGISFAAYDHVTFVLSNDLDCCVWTGTHSFEGKTFTATWVPPWGQEAGTLAHEMSHALGIPHSGWVYHDFDSPWDIMSAQPSAQSAVCGSYLSANDGATRSLDCNEPGAGHIAPHKYALGWIPEPNTVVTEATIGGTWTLEAGALPLGSALKMIKVCLPTEPCTGAFAHYLSVEARVKGLGETSQFDNAIPGDGVIIHDVRMKRQGIVENGCYTNASVGWAHPVDATPGDFDSLTCSQVDGTALYNAQWMPGQVYEAGFYGTRISIDSRADSTYTVTVAPAPSAAPGPFGKSSPVNEWHPSATTGGAPNLRWREAQGATAYEYCIDTTDDDSCDDWINIGNQLLAIVDAGFAETYFWQVRAINASGTTYANGGATDFWQFGFPTLPGSFGKIEPADGSTGVSPVVTFSWGPSSGADEYVFCVRLTTRPDCLSGDRFLGDVVSTTSVSRNLGPLATFSWQVRARRGNGTSAIEVGANGAAPWSFTTQDGAPGDFSKQSPSQFLTGVPRTSTLSWGASAGADGYEYCHDTVDNNQCDTAWVSAGMNRTAPANGLDYSTNYYWQVRATNEGGTTYSGIWFRFTTEGPEVAVTVTTNPPGLSIGVDSVGYTSPHTFMWAIGTFHVLSAGSPQPPFAFSTWSDGGGTLHQVATPSTPTTYTAHFFAKYPLTRASSPLAGGDIFVSPDLGDGSYLSGTAVQLTAMPERGYVFSHWAGDLNGRENPQALTMDAARSVTAVFTTNLIRNGDFALGTEQWTPFVAPDYTYLDLRVVTPIFDQPVGGGALLFSRKPAPAGVVSDAGVFQATGARLFERSPLHAQLSLANIGNTRRRITVAVTDGYLVDSSSCSFWLEPGRPARTYHIFTSTTRSWSNATLWLHADTGSDGGFYVVDDVSMEYDRSGPTGPTLCLDQGTRIPMTDAGAHSPLPSGNLGGVSNAPGMSVPRLNLPSTETGSSGVTPTPATRTLSIQKAAPEAGARR